MSRTNELRKVLLSQLKTVCQEVYFEKADEKKMYPHIVFSHSHIDAGDLNRRDYMIDIDVWDKSDSATEVEQISDNVEDLFNAKNLPQKTILPTCFLVDRKAVPDEDKSIRHRVIRVQVQNYER